jgi:predicted metal-dependent phosphoesterase TrpH
MLTVEYHCHTHASSDSRVRPADLLETCRQRGIDRVVITDHNSIAGAREAQQLDPQRVIVGEEILTTKGELLAAYVTEEIPRGLEPLEAIRRLRQQGAFISVSHPFDVMRKGHWDLPDLLEIAPLVDAIETFNARCLLPAFNSRAQAFATEHTLPGTAGSDAHTLLELGRATMQLPDFANADGLRRAMSEVQHHTRGSGLWVRLASRYAALRNKITIK